MAEEKKTNMASNIGLVVAALVILGAVIFYAWGKTPSTNQDSAKTNNNQTTQTPSTDQSSEAGKLGPNEIAITADNFDQIIKENKVVLIDAFAPWCPHCQRIAPIVTDLSNDYAGKVKFGKMNSNNQDPAQKANFDFAVKNGLQGYPTIWVYKDGKKVTELSGERTKAELKTELDKALQ